MNLLRLIFNPRRVFRPEVEALLDAEMERHRRQIEKLTAYAIQQRDAQLIETVRAADDDDKEAASGGTTGEQSSGERAAERLAEPPADEGRSAQQ